MGLVIQDGKLLIKDGKLATATKPSEACDCCDDTPVVGKCCSYPYDSSGPQSANTAQEAIQLASQSASANSAAIPNSIWTVGTPEGVPWVEGEAWYDEARNQYECTGYWTTTGAEVTCDTENENTCLGPFKYFISGETCEGADPCPEYPPDPKQTGACCYFYSASSDEGSTEEWRCADGITEQDCLMNGLNQTFYPGKTCKEIECPPPDPDDCGYCLEYRDSPGNATLTVANNCVTRQWCQDIFDSGQYCEFYPNECMEPGDADQVFDRKLCEEGSLPCCESPPTPGAGCYLPCEVVLSATGSTPEEAVQNASDLFEGSEGITGTPEGYGLEVRLIDCLDVGGGVQICSAAVLCCGGSADMDSPYCGSQGYTEATCGNFSSEEEFTSNPYGSPQEWYPGKTCDDPSINCECYYTYDEVAATREDAEESFLESYGPYNWSLVGGYIYDQDADQWSYRVVCCEELSYDDQGNEWCGTPNRSNPLP